MEDSKRVAVSQKSATPVNRETAPKRARGVRHREAVELFHVSPNHLYKLEKEGKLLALGIGPNVYYSYAQLCEVTGFDPEMEAGPMKAYARRTSRAA